jgi:hypothetical protein
MRFVEMKASIDEVIGWRKMIFAIAKETEGIGGSLDMIDLRS